MPFIFNCLRKQCQVGQGRGSAFFCGKFSWLCTHTKLQNPSRSSQTCSRSSATADCSLKNARRAERALTRRAPSSDPSFITRIQSPKRGEKKKIRLIMLMLPDLRSVLIEHLCAQEEPEPRAIINTCTISTWLCEYPNSACEQLTGITKAELARRERITEGHSSFYFCINKIWPWLN